MTAQPTVPAVQQPALIRRAVLADAERLGSVHATAHREAYGGLVSSTVLHQVSVEQRVEQWQRILTDDGAARQWVAVVDGAIIGFASSGPPRDIPRVRDLELYSLYVLAAFHHRGIGRALMRAAIGNAPASVWLLAANTRACDFYAGNGFVADGTAEPYPTWENALGIRMVR